MKRQRSSKNHNNSPSKRVKIEEENKVEENNKAFTEEALSHVKIYNELKTEYEEEQVNQHTHLCLSRISKKKLQDNPNLNKQPLLQLLSNACKVMMLTEFEIAAWAVWLDMYKLDDDPKFTAQEYIMNTAF